MEWDHARAMQAGHMEIGAHTYSHPNLARLARDAAREELVRSMHQLSTLSLNMQQAFEKAIGSYLARVNLPSRKDVSELAAALQRVEDKLDRLLPASAATAVPRPPRTRRPPPEELAPPTVGAATPAAAKPARRAKKTASRSRRRS